MPPVLYLGSSRCARPLPHGFTGHVAHPIRSIRKGYGVVKNEKTYFGAREATIFSKRGSPRSGSHQGSSFKRP